MFDEEPREMRNLSVSKIEKALLCPKQFQLAYVDKIPQPTGGKLVAGNVIHEILEFALRQFAKTGKYPDVKTLDDMYLPTWESKIREEEEKPWFIGWRWDKDDPEDRVKREYRPLVTLARNEVLPKLKPWMLGNEPMVEYKIDLELQSEVGPFQLLGYIDLLDDSGILMDWKTTDGPDVSARQQRTWLQFAAYSLMVWPIVGEEETRCQKLFLIRGAKPRFQAVNFVISQKHREYFVNVAAQIWKMVHYGVYFPITDTWACKPDWCPYYMGCQGDFAEKK